MLVSGQALNLRLAGLYNVQFATINTQVPGLLNRNLGGARQSRLLEDPLSVPVGTAETAWVPAGGWSTYLLSTRAPDGRRPWPGGEPGSPTPTRGSADSGPSPARFCGHLWLVLSLPHRPFLPVRSGSTRCAARGFPACWTSPGFLRRPAPLIYMRRPAPCTSHLHSPPCRLLIFTRGPPGLLLSPGYLHAPPHASATLRDSGL